MLKNVLGLRTQISCCYKYIATSTWSEEESWRWMYGNRFLITFSYLLLFRPPPASQLAVVMFDISTLHTDRASLGSDDEDWLDGQPKYLNTDLPLSVVVAPYDTECWPASVSSFSSSLMRRDRPVFPRRWKKSPMTEETKQTHLGNKTNA